ncbi:hypothetical protein G7046_g6690 [Stylonectria norvegica]|nr:hypothetical protein G7046_g6690 [Stylonectria norvegica]
MVAVVVTVVVADHVVSLQRESSPSALFERNPPTLMGTGGANLLLTKDARTARIVAPKAASDPIAVSIRRTVVSSLIRCLVLLGDGVAESAVRPPCGITHVEDDSSTRGMGLYGQSRSLIAHFVLFRSNGRSVQGCL